MILRSSKAIKEPAVFSDLRDAEKETGHVEICAEVFTAYIPVPPESCNKKYARGTYECNPFTLECSCPERAALIPVYAGRDIRGACAHLAGLFIRTVRDTSEGFIPFMLEQQLRYGREDLYRVSSDGEEIIAGFGGQSLWVNVYFRNADWAKYAFHLRQKRWARSKIPLHEERVRAALLNSFVLTP